MPSGTCKRDDRSFWVPVKEKLDDQKRVFHSIWRMWSLFAGWITALGLLPVSANRISQVAAFSRTHSVQLNPRIEGTENACPQFSGGRFCQVVAKTGLTVVHSKKTDPWGVFDFFQMFWKIFQFSFPVSFVLLTFQFQVCSTLGRQLSLSHAKISNFAFSPTSKRSLQVCVVHIPNLPAAPKGQPPMTLHSNWHYCTWVERTIAKIRDVLV